MENNTTYVEPLWFRECPDITLYHKIIKAGCGSGLHRLFYLKGNDECFDECCQDICKMLKHYGMISQKDDVAILRASLLSDKEPPALADSSVLFYILDFVPEGRYVTEVDISKVYRYTKRVEAILERLKLSGTVEGIRAMLEPYPWLPLTDEDIVFNTLTTHFRRTDNTSLEPSDFSWMAKTDGITDDTSGSRTLPSDSEELPDDNVIVKNVNNNEPPSDGGQAAEQPSEDTSPDASGSDEGKPEDALQEAAGVTETEEKDLRAEYKSVSAYNRSLMEKLMALYTETAKSLKKLNAYKYRAYYTVIQEMIDSEHPDTATAQKLCQDYLHDSYNRTDTREYALLYRLLERTEEYHDSRKILTTTRVCITCGKTFEVPVPDGLDDSMYFTTPCPYCGSVLDIIYDSE